MSKRQVDNVVYNTEGDGVERVATSNETGYPVVLYRGKNGGWFFDSGGILMPSSEHGAYRWLVTHEKYTALNKYFPPREA